MIHTERLLHNYAALGFSTAVDNPVHFLIEPEKPSVTPAPFGVCVRPRIGTPTFVPTATSDPEEYLEALAGVIKESGSVDNVPTRYAVKLAARGYKLQVCDRRTREYVFETRALATLPGSGFASERRYLRRAERLYEFRLLTQDAIPSVLDFEAEWRGDYLRRHPGESISHADAVSAALAIADSVPESYRLRILGGFERESDKLVSVAVGVMLSADTWHAPFRYALTAGHPYLSAASFTMLARHYADVPFENDGCHRVSLPGLTAFKNRFLTPAVAGKQQRFFTIHR